MSGVLASLAAGLLMGNLGVLREKEQNILTGREFVVAFWDFAAFVANSLIFLLIGLAAGAVPFERVSPAALATIVALVLLARALTVYPLCLPFARTRWAVPLPTQHVLWWGGLRGALCLALALSLPHGMDHRDDIVIAAFDVVAFARSPCALTSCSTYARAWGGSTRLRASMTDGSTASSGPRLCCAFPGEWHRRGRERR